MNYDFQQIIGTQVQTLIYFKIVSEYRTGRKSYKQLVGNDAMGNTYTATGIIDCKETIRAINVKLT